MAAIRRHRCSLHSHRPLAIGYGITYTVTCNKCGWEDSTAGSAPSLAACPQCGARRLRVYDEYWGDTFTTGDDEGVPDVVELVTLSDYVGRDDEVHALIRRFLVERKHRVVVWGPRGIGKTALAERFAEVYRARSGGAPLMLRAPSDTLPEAAELRPGPRDVVVIDELTEDVDDVLGRLATAYRDTRVLILSRAKPASRAADAVIELKGLPATSIAGILRRSGLSESVAVRAAARISEELYGHPVVVATVAELLSRRIPIDQILGDLRSFQRPGPGSDMPAVVEAILDQSDLLFKLVSRDPSLLHTLTPRQFEELVAEMLSREGFDVTLTPIARDGGKDIYAAKKDRLGAILYVVECKKYAPDRPVGVSFVRGLYGVVRAENATAGLLVTTSRFTKPAQEFQERLQYQLTLQDYHDVSRWLRTSFATA